MDEPLQEQIREPRCYKGMSKNQFHDYEMTQPPEGYKM